MTAGSKLLECSRLGVYIQMAKNIHHEEDRILQFDIIHVLGS